MSASKSFQGNFCLTPVLIMLSNDVVTQHPSAKSTLPKNVDFKPRGDIFDAATRQKIIEGQCQAAEAQAKADRTKELQKLRQREKISKRFKARAIEDKKHLNFVSVRTIKEGSSSSS
jgi:hypothetical protein